MRNIGLRQFVSLEYGALTAGVVAISWAAIFVRLADEAPALTLAAYRMLIAALVLGAAAALIAWRRGDRRPPRGQLLWLGLGGACLAGHFWAWFASLELTSVGSSVVIVTMQPLLGAILAFVFLRERPLRNEYTGIALAAIGLMLIGGGDLASSTDELAGDGLALLGGLLAAAYHTIGRRQRIATSAAMYSAYVYAVAAAALWLLVALVRPEVSGFDSDTWTFIVLLALVPQVIGHTVFNWALGHLRVVTVGIAHLGEPLGATVLAIFILSETPTPWVLAGAPFILAGLVIGLRRQGSPALEGSFKHRQEAIE